MVNRYGCSVAGCCCFFLAVAFFIFIMSLKFHITTDQRIPKKRITKIKSKMLTFGWPDFIENGLGSNDQVNG